MPDHTERADHVLVVDDVESVRNFLCMLLRDSGYQATEAPDGTSALRLAHEDTPDVVLLDIGLPDVSGLQVLEELHGLDADLPVVMVTGLDDVDTAVRAMHLGAYDYLTKPFSNTEALASVARAAEHRRLSRKVGALRERLGRVPPLTELLGTSGAIARLRDHATELAATTRPALFLGEHGTGKQILARWIHARSTRARSPFVAIDCAGLITAVADLELFGYDNGTDSRSIFPHGEVELANGGTLFLGNVESLPLAAQDGLLAYLQQGCVRRVGGTASLPLDVRLLAGTAAELRELVAGRLFRRDLYLLLTDTILTVPSLRSRADDILHLVHVVLEATGRELGRELPSLSPEATEVLVAYPWPGNVAELHHVVRRAMVLATDRIEPRHLAVRLSAEAVGMPAGVADGHLSLAERVRLVEEAVEREAILDALSRAHGNKTRAAERLGLSYKTLHQKMKKLGFEEPHEASP